MSIAAQKSGTMTQIYKMLHLINNQRYVLTQIYICLLKNLFSVVFLGNITVLAMYNNPSIRLYVVGANNYSPLRVQLQ